jgi:signal transduction histidine kinase
MHDLTKIAIAGALLSTLMAAFIVYFVFAYRRRQRSHEREKEQMQLLFERDAIRAQLEISEEILKKVSAEIHDNIGQRLTLARLQLMSVSDSSGHIGRSGELIGQAIHDLRNLTRSLNSTFILEHGLIASIRRECEIISESGVMKASFTHRGEHPEIGPQREIILFRCVQEALNNAVKHSGGNMITVLVDVSSIELRITVRDNGSGLRKEVLAGVGISSLKDRMQILNGQMTMRSAPDGGLEVVFTLQPTGGNHEMVKL